MKISASVLLPTLLSFLSTQVHAADVLQNSGFSTCSGKEDIIVEKLNLQFNKETNQVNFDVAGTSKKSQEVTLSLIITAYGKKVYQKDSDPCDAANKVAQLCPIPSGSFNATGAQTIPAQYAKMIPAVAFTVPDLDGLAKLEIRAKDTGAVVACIQSEVGNGKTIKNTAVPIIAAGIAGVALIVSGLSALAGSGGPGVSGPSPSFGDVIGWFQSMALNGMLTVDYPPVYRSFSKNFAFSGLIIPVESVQKSIDSFRGRTGGNLTYDNVDFLRNRAMFLYDQGVVANSTIGKRALGLSRVVARDEAKTPHFVQGIQGYVEPLLIPKSDTFMTILLAFAVIVAAIIVGILLFKLILELFAMCGKLSKGLEGFRRRYWLVIGKTIVNLILLLYGVWTLYCVYQFTIGDSWAARILAGVTLGIFTLVLGWFTWRICSLARKYKKAEGSAAGLYENKETWVTYSLFYEHYKKNYWWMFIPVIVYLFARGVIIAAGNGHGMAQVAAHIFLELVMLLLLLFIRPYTHKSGNWISITIQVVRVLSILCILVFVDKLAIPETPKAITGVVLVVIQSALTALLAILIIVNGILHCCRANPHRKARKEAEKQKRETQYSLLSNPPQPYDVEPGGKKFPRNSAYEIDPYTPEAQAQRASLLPSTASPPRMQHRPSRM